MSSGFSRRQVIRAGVAVTAAAASPIPALGTNGKEKEPSPVRLGVASYTFRNFSRAQLMDFMKQVRVSDLNAKDVKDHLPTNPADEARALADYTSAGIKLRAAGAIYFSKNDEADIRSKFEYCRRAGIGTIVAGDPIPAALPNIEKFAGEFDIRVAIHNHGPEDKIFPSPLDVLKAVREMDPRMGCCIDVGHTMRAGTDVVQAIHEAGTRLFNVHMKDLANPHEKESQVAVGQGVMPLPEIFKALIAIKYRGFVDLEYEIEPDNPMPGVISSFAYMRGVLAGMGYGTST